MSLPRTSVIVVSRARPAELTLCLTGLAQLDHPDFEVIVVADAAGLAAADATPFADRLRKVACDEANISAARNLGINVSAGDVVAFIDDDAVPEPGWLSFLSAPFADPAVEAAGGFVIGRNGISFQRRAAAVDRYGRETPLAMSGEEAEVHRTEPGRAIKTEGTNCAFRRATLAALGGFDPAIRFYLDETELDLRLAERGAQVAIVPLAQVHHGFAASERRRGDRVPLSLHEIGASTAVLLRRHAAGEPHGPVFDALRADQRARMLRLMVSGACEPRDVGRALATLEDGIADGGARPLPPLPPLSPPRADSFLHFETDPPFVRSRVVAGRTGRAERHRRAARRAVLSGERTTLFLFGAHALFHKVRFVPPGYWEQRGGLFGRSLRDQPLLRFAGLAARAEEERSRIERVRRLEGVRVSLL